MRLVTASFRDRYAPWEAASVVRLDAPDLGPVAPGQFVLLGQSDRRRPVLPVPLLPMGQTVGETLDILFPEAGALSLLEDTVRLDRPLRLYGPAGRLFAIEGGTRRALLAGGGAGLGPLLFLAAMLIRRGLDVTFITARDEPGYPPAAALPPEVEYVPTPGDQVLARIEELLPWADALYLALPPTALPAVVALLRRRLLRLRKGFAQALIPPLPLPCGVGACDLCVIRAAGGYRRACKDGLVFDLLALG